MRSAAVLLLVVSCGLSLAGAGQDGRPLPERSTFLEETRKRLASDEDLQSHYTFKERRAKLTKGPDGSWVPEETKLYEVYPSVVGELTYQRLVETDGVPTPAPELAQADRAQLAKVREFIRLAREESARDERRRLAREQEALARDRETIADVVSVLRFELERRETIDGRPAIVVSFQPIENPKPTTREGKLVSHFSGLVWVDERELQVVRAEAEAMETISFGLGIVARIHQGTRGEFTRRQVADGSWLPAVAELTGTARVLLVKKIERAWHAEYFDYVRIDPEHPPRFIALPEDVRPEPNLRLTPRGGGGQDPDRCASVWTWAAPRLRRSRSAPITRSWHGAASRRRAATTTRRSGPSWRWWRTSSGRPGSAAASASAFPARSRPRRGW